LTEKVALAGGGVMIKGGNLGRIVERQDLRRAERLAKK